MTVPRVLPADLTDDQRAVMTDLLGEEKVAQLEAGPRLSLPPDEPAPTPRGHP